MSYEVRADLSDSPKNKSVPFFYIWHDIRSVDADKQGNRVWEGSRRESDCDCGGVIEMNKPNQRFLVYVKSNKDFIFVETYSGFWNFLPDPEGKRYLLSHSSSDSDVGSAIVDAVSVSRQVDPQVDPEFFNVMGRVSPQYAAWVGGLMDEFGYKNKRAMFKDMKSCSVEMVAGSIVIEPSHHEKLEAWSGKGISEDDKVVIPTNSPPDQIGLALRLALSRCT